ncbi:MAG TPA: DNA polymerase III subunit gamma/tau [Candidatus Ignatzschineria merdigallinarum]|uniref:DNA polymerase III subunit gamma/tau n=1 Tax=Candidatus Ignatzschineria merdigallinarum TaxID=2838621 RepID=A0A9D1Q5X5_9GAMM|nr:DNA polymerase III subunit gamma/tau [Candidatus Ignatzschineria merdigallinarum]
MTQQVLALKWRPRTFNEVIGQPHVVQALSNGLDNDRLHHAFLFTGTRGVGKTTLARIFAKSLNCEKGVSSNPCGECSVCTEVDEGRFVDLIEIDAASRTRVEDTREILDNVQYAPTRGRYKIYLIDEVHMLSNSSFNALLKTLEEPPSHVKFLLATTDPQKLPVTVLSRCLRFQLKRIQDQEIAEQLEKILISENIPFETEAIKLIAKAGDGSMRDALSLLDQAIAYTGQNVQFQQTHEMLGLIDTQYLVRVLEALVARDRQTLLSALSLLKSHGLDYYRFLEDLIDAFHLLTMVQLSKEMGEHENAELVALAEAFTAEDLQLYYQIALNGRKDLHNHPNAEVGFEMTLLRMVLFAPTAPVGVMEAQKKSQTVSLNSADALSNAEIEASAGIALKEHLSDKVSLPENQSGQLLPVSATSASKEASAVDLPWEDPPKADMTPSNAPEVYEKSRSDEQELTADLDHQIEDEISILEPPVFEISEAEHIVSSSEIVESSNIAVLENDRLDDELIPVWDVEEPFSANNASIMESSINNGELTTDRPFVLDSTLSESSRLQTASLLNNNEEWLSLVSGLTLESVLSGIAHSLVFKSFDGEYLILQRPLSVKDFRVDEAEMRLAMAISNSLNVKISCKIEYVETLNLENLHERTERLDEERLQQALSSFKQDEVVQYLEQELGAKLLMKTLKPLDDC